MKRVIPILLLAVLPSIAGCSGKKADDSGSPAPAAAVDTSAKPPAAGQVLAVSLYDDGARASEAPVDGEKAEAGAKLFSAKGCTTCHAYGRKLTGPDLKGVTTRRTAAWMEHQIMSPDVMTRTDPISHGLMLANNNLQMLNLHLTQPEAQSLVEYFKKLDKAR